MAEHPGFAAAIGRTERREDRVTPALLSRMAATLDVPPPADGTLPPLWHWGMFQHWLAPDRLGADGHARRGGFLPDTPGLERRMWAGGRLDFYLPLRAGDAVSRTSTITAIEAKHGASGALVFLTLRHEIARPDGLALTEEQDLVFRAAPTGLRPANHVPPAPPGASRRIVQPDAVLLFRYSALTGNAHRIHYDADFTRGTEGYPDLVVHGPLQATWLAALAASIAGRRIGRFSFLARRPAYVGRTLTLEAWEEEGQVSARSLDPNGAVCMSASAEFPRDAPDET